MRDARDRMFLIVVGRQPVVLGPTKVSKKSQVLRASLRRKAICSAVRCAGRGVTGRLIHQAMLGETNQSTQSGPGYQQRAGPLHRKIDQRGEASTGPIHMVRQ